ncbi:hypothetical protein [Filibacter tadaridae]|uniref:hypothetical protein n=1 Tax=Filibacter tadaridae TaxID=2483811 RepID=UPI001359CD80|nr:hypothetical protein [Filibacter tadaridae]
MIAIMTTTIILANTVVLMNVAVLVTAVVAEKICVMPTLEFDWAVYKTDLAFAYVR